MATDTDSQSWLDGGFSPLRFSSSDDRGTFAQGMFTLRHTTDKTKFVGTLSAYDSGNQAVGLNELFLEYQLAGGTDSKLGLKVGSFFPEISLENTGPGWTARSPLTNSAINTWLGEEIRITGLQFSFRKSIETARNIWKFETDVGVNAFNDPASSILAWRGWGLHDRQLRFGEGVDIAPLPALNETGSFKDQAPEFEPFEEVDNRLGFQAALSLQKNLGTKIKLYHYDNNAQSTALVNGQYGWQTSFTHVGVTIPLYEGIKLKSQWLYGNSLMGDLSMAAVHFDFEAAYLGLSASKGKWLYTVRYDVFKVLDLDNTADDNNNQDGNAWVLALRYDVNKNLAILAEHLAIDETNQARAYFNLPLKYQHTQTQMAIQYRF